MEKARSELLGEINFKCKGLTIIDSIMDYPPLFIVTIGKE